MAVSAPMAAANNRAEAAHRNIPFRFIRICIFHFLAGHKPTDNSDKDTHFTVIDERDKTEEKGLTAFPTSIPHIAPRKHGWKQGNGMRDKRSAGKLRQPDASPHLIHQEYMSTYQMPAISTTLSTAASRPATSLPPAVAKWGAPPPPPLMRRAASRTMLPA